MKNLIITLIGILCAPVAFAQSALITSGTITYEKQINMLAITRQTIGPNPSAYQIREYEEYKVKYPQFIKINSTLIFAGNKSLFTPIYPQKEPYSPQGNPMSRQFNTVYSDFTTRTSTVQKQVYSDQFLIQDSLRKIKWRITGETREIAGYTCRRANGLMFDSVSIVAFYTDKIRLSGGPESYNGLPGMILSLIVPHENVRYDAINVTVGNVAPTAILPPKKGKAVTNKKLIELLKEAMKQWGPMGVYELKVYTM